MNFQSNFNEVGIKLFWEVNTDVGNTNESKDEGTGVRTTERIRYSVWAEWEKDRGAI